MGQALGRLLVERGESVAAVASRLQEHAVAAAEFVGGGAKGASYRELGGSAERILIAVPDTAIGCVAQALAKGGMHAGVVLHTSGALGPEALARLATAGVACGCLHPLQTVATPAEGVRALPGVSFAVDGDAEAVAWALQIVELLGGHALRIPAAARPIYHAAAVMASNAVVAVMAAAVILMKEAGVPEIEALRALGPLAQTSLENALRLGPAAALTGPIQRGDHGTVRSHLDALSQAPGAAADLYRAAGLMALGIARERGLPEAGAAALEELLRKGVRDA
jgi:predicted short-subunit dehydrogenase-like oxidoreductase (DUF2520 family)